jgi:signal transduction histidine kinase
VREAAADIDHEVARLDRTVGDVLDFARPCASIPAGRWPRSSRMRARVASRPRPPAQPASGTLTTDGEHGASVNLVENAREASWRRAARRARRSRSRPAAPAGRVLLWVSDRGPGVPAGDLPHVFEPYFTTKRTGTGLGLAIARKVVEALGGAIRLESREGEGTRVEVELPAEGPAAREVR